MSSIIFLVNQSKRYVMLILLNNENDTPYESVIGWQRLIAGNIEYEQFEGNHFFAFEQYERTAEIINKSLL